jgi:hypothetical protein
VVALSGWQAVRRLLILETHADLLDLRRPRWRSTRATSSPRRRVELVGTEHAALVAMLREEGFSRVEVVHREPLRYRLAPAAYRRRPRTRASAPQQGACSWVHAYRA